MVRKLGLTIVVAALAAAVVYLRPWVSGEGAPEASRSLAEATVAVVAPPVRTITLPESAVTVRYPEGYAAAADTAQLVAEGAEGACSGSFDYCIYRVGGTPATGLSLRRRADLTNEADCVLEPTPAFAGRLPDVAGASDHAVAGFGTLTRAEAEGRETLDLRRLHFRSVCVELVARQSLASGQRDEAAWAGLMAILDGVALPDGRSGLWTTGR